MYGIVLDVRWIVAEMRLEDALDAQPMNSARLRRALEDAEAAGLHEEPDVYSGGLYETLFLCPCFDKSI